MFNGAEHCVDKSGESGIMKADKVLCRNGKESQEYYANIDKHKNDK